MAEHNKTVSNSLYLLGGGPSSLWDAHNWDEFKWDEGTVDFRQTVLHLVSTSLSPSSDAASLKVTRYLEAQSLSMDTLPIKRHTRVLTSETIGFVSDATSEQLGDGSGYTYVFVSNTNNAEERDDTSWATVAGGAGTWTTATVSSVSWS